MEKNNPEEIDPLDCLIGDTVHHTLARRLFILWADRTVSQAEIDDFF
ncbi:hypothetical protein [Rhizobium binae]|nr:hypothetical protein [Rhizobium binae]MBX4967757.1 hypothetical protein [Rhizobium binae]